MLALAARIGKHRAHELVHRAALAGPGGGHDARGGARAPTPRSRPRCRATSSRRCCAPSARSAPPRAPVDAIVERARAMSDERAPSPGYLGADARVRSGPGAGARRRRVRARARRRAAAAPRARARRPRARRSRSRAIPAADAPRAARRAARAARTPRRDRRPALRRPRQRPRARARAAGRDAAGWLNAGRPRREAGRIAFRIALRDAAARPRAATLRLRRRAHRRTRARERDTPMPDYTYLQAAQPTTAGHWLLSFAYPALRDAQRLADDFACVNRSPAGAGGVNGSRFAARPRAARAAARLRRADRAHARRDVADRRPHRGGLARRHGGDERQPLRRGPRALRQRRVRPARASATSSAARAR